MSLTFKCINYLTYYNSEWLYIFVLWDRDLFQFLITQIKKKNALLIMEHEGVLHFSQEITIRAYSRSIWLFLHYRKVS